VKEIPYWLKLATVWLVVATGVFLSIQAWERHQEGTRFTVQGSAIEIRRSRDGHYHWPGRVNGRAVDFLVDTGATRTALPGELARRWGLQPEREVRSSTAGGVVTGYEARVDLALDGGVAVQQLRVTVLPDLAAPLLGMDVLGRLRFTQADGRLQISAAE
jgi:aspartyl protease family protein